MVFVRQWTHDCGWKRLQNQNIGREPRLSRLLYTDRWAAAPSTSPFVQTKMIRGYLSVEWLALCLIGLPTSVWMAWVASYAPKEPPNLLVIGLFVSIGLYIVLRLYGKTPVGIAHESQPAAQGHRLLSFIAAVCSMVAWGLAFVGRQYA